MLKQGVLKQAVVKAWLLKRLSFAATIEFEQ